MRMRRLSLLCATGRHLSSFHRDITGHDFTYVINVSYYDQIVRESIHIIQALAVIAGQRGT
jgi:hypothetical protein